MVPISFRGSHRLCSLLLMATALIGLASAVDVTICADFNTADMNKSILPLPWMKQPTASP